MWIDKPELNGKKNLIPLLRARAGGKVEGDLTGEPLRCFVHFCGGRSWPCIGNGCTLCKRAIPKRLYAYYPILGKEDRIAILELTSTAEGSLISQMTPVTDVPRGHIHVSRKAGKRNNPCMVKWEEKEENKTGESRTINQKELKSTLMRIWCLPEIGVDEDERYYLNRLNEAIRLRTTKQG